MKYAYIIFAKGDGNLEITLRPWILAPSERNNSNTNIHKKKFDMAIVKKIFVYLKK